MTPLDLFRELARPARHDHRNLTPTQTALEGVARATATGCVLGVHAVLRAGAGVVSLARTAHAITHLLRNR